MKKIIGIFVCMLLIAATVLPALGTINKDRGDTNNSRFLVDNDMQLTSIVKPDTGVAGIISPLVKVTNDGAEYELAIVNLTIEKILSGGGTILEYYEEVSVDFDPFEIKDVVFPVWVPADWNLALNVDIEYLVCSCVTLITGIDPILDNNCKCKVITLHFPYLHDVGVESIDSPNGCLSSLTAPVIVNIKNYGQFPEKNIFTNVEISDGTSLIYEESKLIIEWMQPQEVRTITFPTVAFLGPGLYYVTVCTTLNGDQNPINDCLTITVGIDFTQPDLIIYDNSKGYIVKIVNDVYEAPNWPDVTQVGKWLKRFVFGPFKLLSIKIELQNDGTDPLEGYTIKIKYLSGPPNALCTLVYTKNGNIKGIVPVSTSSETIIRNGITIEEAIYKFLKIYVMVIGSSDPIEIGINVKSICKEDSVIFSEK